ncbi:DUF397 domain-containing protein [Nocardiopsis sp. CNT312]|uniref:DUF397 domain-containing protein n=1 Tax=Nocardiopsis sp. CNT312 TaxID=1137268 RepID=UPI0009E04823|nr:DUF397 domain-containing protein [Nocardiopsis sp. CNT312]
MSIAHATPSNWRKSSYSSSHGQNCVEVADLSHGVAVRDTQNRKSGHITFGAEAWSALLGTMRTGR